jgi:AraC-like DNA-binding protein
MADDRSEGMKRATQLFDLDEQRCDSPFVERTWRTRSAPEPSFISVARSHWAMVVTWRAGAPQLTIRGAETKATIVPIPEDAEFLVIWLSHGTYMPRLPLVGLTDRAVDLPTMSSRTFLLDGSAWEFPGPDDVDAFVARLVRRGLLTRDPIAVAALQGDAAGLSRRSLQRRVSRATGLTSGVIRQIARAERAVELLERGRSVVETASLTGYSDQAHLIRSLKRFMGQTPSQVAGFAA